MADSDQKELEYYRVRPGESKLEPTSATERLLKKILELSGAGAADLGIGPMPLDFTLKEPANRFIAKIINRVINDRNEVYHATWPYRIEEILDSGHITSKIRDNQSGVSVSRIPSIPTFAKSPSRIVLDPNKMPEAQPLAENAFRKTKPNFDWTQLYPENNPVHNEAFEFENRTKNEPISIDAIKKILVNREDKFTAGEIAKKAGNIPVELFDNPKDLDTYRAAKAWMDYYRLRKAIPGFQGEGVGLVSEPFKYYPEVITNKY